MRTKLSRRSFVSSVALIAGAAAASARAQFGGRQRDRGDASGRSSRFGNANPSAAAKPQVDPAGAIERELPSLRIDLKLTADQAPLFDSFERQVRNAADAERLRLRHFSAFRVDDAGSVTALTVQSTMADDDAQRADATRQALERVKALYAALDPAQQKHFDQRILQAIREPLGTS